jgi:predicted GIY-YIG superfamily endonuclease
VNDLHNQLGIQNQNQQIINENKKEGLIYVLKVDDETYKIGSTIDIKKRMKQYNVGQVNELPIVFAYKTSDIKTVETCIKKNLENYRLKKNKNNELFKIDHEFIKDTIIYCNKFNTLKVKENTKLYKAKDDKNWMIIIDKKNTDINQLFKEVKQYKRKTTSKKPSKKPSKKSS